MLTWAVPLIVLQAHSRLGTAQEPQPGADAQVRTGSKSGLETETRLQNLLADHQYAQLAAHLNELPPAEAQFYRGILANRSNDPVASLRLLEPLLDSVTASGDKPREKLLRRAMAEDYLRLGDWQKAGAAYQTLAQRLHSELSADELDEIEMPLKLLPLVSTHPPMTVEPSEPFVLQISRDPLGLIDVPVFVDAMPHSWMLDPTAPFNLISRSAAREVGIKVSEETAVVRTLTGRPIRMHAAIIPRFTIGGRLTLRNMTAFVYDDADYYFPHTRYQVQGVLGYAALSALGSVTITNNGTIEVTPAKIADDSAPVAVEVQKPQVQSALSAYTQKQASQKPAPQDAKSGVPFYLDGDQIVVALGKPGDERYYAIDAGGQQSYLTSRYYFEHSNEFDGRRMQLFAVPGAEKMQPQPAYLADSVALPIGRYTVHVHELQVLTQPLNAQARDDVYGVLGIDVLDQLRGYTFDYRTMRFRVRPE